MLLSIREAHEMGPQTFAARDVRLGITGHLGLELYQHNITQSLRADSHLVTCRACLANHARLHTILPTFGSKEFTSRLTNL